MPLDSIGRNLDASFANLNKALQQVNGLVLPQATQTLRQAQQTIGAAHGMLAEDATLRQNLGQALQEIQRAARSSRQPARWRLPSDDPTYSYQPRRPDPGAGSLQRVSACPPLHLAHPSGGRGTSGAASALRGRRAARDVAGVSESTPTGGQARRQRHARRPG
ncbi:hypothetical protein G6F31_019314 [Rhizopus arrhizus]|nr:hypothetical protein G6F31_019314 [Rhizopus arrhizus]